MNVFSSPDSPRNRVPSSGPSSKHGGGYFLEAIILSGFPYSGPICLYKKHAFISGYEGGPKSHFVENHILGFHSVPSANQLHGANISLSPFSRTKGRSFQREDHNIWFLCSLGGGRQHSMASLSLFKVFLVHIGRDHSLYYLKRSLPKCPLRPGLCCRPVYRLAFYRSNPPRRARGSIASSSILSTSFR